MLDGSTAQRKGGNLPAVTPRGTVPGHMVSSLSLQQSLFRHQAKQIARQVQGASPAFRAYRRRYEAATRRHRGAVSLAEVHARVRAADVVYVGDYHTLRVAQQAYQDLVEAALASGRRVVLALEFVEGKHQAALDAFLAGRLGQKAFLSRIGHPYRGAFDIWPGFAPVLQLARRRRLEVVAIDRRASGPRSLALRDEYAAQRIAKVAGAADRPLVLALVGQFHVTPAHLPARVEARLGAQARQHLVVYQNAEGVYWQLARAGLVEETPAVELSAKELCLVNTSPVVCQRSFLDYVEAEAGDAPLDEPGLTATFRHLAREIGRFTGLRVGAAADEVLVLTASEKDPLGRLARRASFTSAEKQALARHILKRESAWIPRAKAAWLASLSLNHAAEEAAHFVRHLAVGDAMERERPRQEAFWARCLEEALGFFGSRLVNPTRRCTGLDEWAWHFQQGDGQLRAVAAFTLAVAAALRDDVRAAQRLVPSGALFHPVSHALGYLLGDALSRAFTARRLSRTDVRALFRDPFEQPAVAFAALARQVGLGSAPKATGRAGLHA
jgi:hypothetical protein